MRRSIGYGLLSLVLAGAATPAWSTLTIETKLTNFKFTVTDLTPDDGQTAGYAWVVDPVPQNATSATARMIKDGYLLQEDVHELDGPFATLSSQAAQGQAKAFASVSADSVYAFAQSSGRVSGIAGSEVGTEYPAGNQGIWLAPGTRLTFTGDVSFKSTNDKVCTNPDLDTTSCLSASGSVYLSFRAPGSSYGLWSTSQSFGANESDLGVKEENRSLLLAFENNRSQAVYIGFGLSTSSNVFAPNLPEPSSYALALVGLALAGISLRRRQARLSH